MRPLACIIFACTLAGCKVALIGNREEAEALRDMRPIDQGGIADKLVVSDPKPSPAKLDPDLLKRIEGSLDPDLLELLRTQIK